MARRLTVLIAAVLLTLGLAVPAAASGHTLEDRCEKDKGELEDFLGFDLDGLDCSNLEGAGPPGADA